MSLSPSDVARFWEHGFLSDLPALSPEEAAAALAGLEALEAAEAARRGGAWTDRHVRPWEMPPQPLEAWARPLATHPAVLDAVAAVLGPDLLLRNADVFIKEPGTTHGIGWHTDTAERGPDAEGMLTVWLGLSASTPDNGGLVFSRGSHRADIADRPPDKYRLTFTEEARASLDPAASVDNLMGPGRMSLHLFGTAHRSGPNRTAGRRVAFVGRYLATRVSAATAESGVAVLVRGRDTHGHFALKDRFAISWNL